MQLSQIISLAALGVFLLFLLVGFLIGLGRGIKKASLRLGVFFVFTLIAFLITPAISKLALGIDLSFVGINGSLTDYINQQIASNSQAADFVASSPTMQSFVEKLPYMVLNLVAFFVVFLVVSFIGFIVYQIMKAIFLRNKKPKAWKEANAYKVAFDDKKPSKHRLLGGLVGAINSLIFMGVLFLPVSGLVTLAYDLAFETENVAQASTTYTPVSKLLQEQMPKEVLDGVKAYRNSALGITSTAVGADTFMFDGLTNIEIQSQEGKLSISFRREVKNFAKIYNNIEFLTQLDFDNVVYKDLDYKKIQKALDTVFESNLITTLAPEALNWVIKDINSPNQTQFGLSLSNEEIAILNKVTAEYTKVFGSVYKGLKNDFSTVAQVAVDAGKSGLVDEVLSQNINLDEIRSILKANDKQIITSTFTNLFKAISLRVGLVEVINNAFADISEPNLVLSPISYSNISWEGVTEDLTTISNNLLDILDNVSTQFNGNIQQVVEDNPFELLHADTTILTSKVGVIMNTLQNTNLLVNATGQKVVYNQLMDYLNTSEYSEYVDFAPFKAQNAWVNEMANLNNIILSIKKSAILSDIVNNINDLSLIQYNEILQKLSVIDANNSQTYTYNILNSVLNSNVFKKGINIAFNLLNDLIADNQSSLGSGTDLGKVQGHLLTTQQEKAYVLSFFDNIISYASELDLNGNQNQLVSKILSSDLSKLGLALDSIKNSAIFGKYEENGIEKDGVYISLIGALNNNATVYKYIDLNIALDESFDGWNVEFTRVQNILENLQNIKINNKPFVDAILDGEDMSSLANSLTANDIDLLIDPLIESQLLSKNVVLFVDTINQMMADFTNQTIDSVTTEQVVLQKEQVKQIIKKGLGLTSVLTGNFDEATLKQNSVVLGQFLDLLKTNKTDFENAVFGQTYDALVNYLKTDANFGDKITDLLNEYENQTDVNWENLFKLFVEMENQDFSQGFTTEFKSLFGQVFADMKKDIHYQSIAVDTLNFLESFKNADGVSSVNDFVNAYTNSLQILQTGQNNFEQGSIEYANKVGDVLDFLNGFVAINDFDILDFKLINNYSNEIASANNFKNSMTDFESVNFESDDPQQINETVDNLLDSLATSQLMLNLFETSSIDFEVENPTGKLILRNRIEAGYTGQMQSRLLALFNV